MPTPRPAERLDADLARRLASVLARLASPHDGERLAACAAIDRILAPRGLRLPELIAGLAEPPPAPRPDDLPDDTAARELLRRIDASGWTPGGWQAQFLAGLRLWRGRFTLKQRSKIAEIAARAGVR